MRFPLFTLLLSLFIFHHQLSAQCVSGDCTNGRGIFMYKSGAKYIGNFKNGEIHGLGTCYYSDGSKYKGEWINRYPEGKGTKTYADGSEWTGYWKKGNPVDQYGNKVQAQLVTKGEQNNDGTDIQTGCLKGDCINGQGVYAYPDGSKYEGQFKNRQMDGWGTWYYPNGDKHIGTFHKNYAHGKGTTYHRDHSKTVGEWENGEFIGNSLIEKGRDGCIEGNCQNGRGTYIYPNGAAKYIGTFVNLQPHGNGVCTFANGDRYKGAWENGSFNGMGTLTKKDGTKINGKWFNGKFVGNPYQNIVTKPQINKPTKSQQTPQTTYQKPLKVWALIVGIASYNHMPALRYTDDDAYRMYAFLKSPEGGALDDEHISILIDEAATKQKILNEMTRIFNQAGPNDLVMMYFSGHGLKGSFLPIDFDGYNNKIFHEEINNILRQSPAKYKLCIADACHSGSLLAMRDGGVQNALSHYYRSLAQANAGTALIMSSKSEETSLESSGLRQGVFSHFLIRGLKGEADTNHNNIVSVQELFNFIDGNVQNYTGFRQSPMIQGDFDKNMTVAVKRF